MTKILIGRGVTNSNGVATMTEDANGVAINGYTGTGAGEVDFSAGCTIDGDTFQSETYEVLDCYKYDSGMTDYNNIWTESSSNVLTRNGDYSTIKETSSSTAFVTITNIPLTDYRLEVDVYQVDGTTDEWCVTVLKSDYTSITSANSKLGEWKHISLDLTDIETNSRIRVNTGGTAIEMRFKNFKVYPI